MVKIVARVIAVILVLLLGWGVLCPILISSPSDILVVFGFATIIIVPAIAYVISRPLFKDVSKKAKDDYEMYYKY
jgi:protein-S-isoprenylcysteine O-methyltransferase Ste14